MDFEEYLIKKKIDSAAFQKANNSQWEEFKTLFDQMHPNSFTAQKLFLINTIRRSYPLKLDQEVEVTTKSKTTRPKPLIKKKSTAKPVVKPKMKK